MPWQNQSSGGGGGPWGGGGKTFQARGSGDMQPLGFAREEEIP